MSYGVVPSLPRRRRRRSVSVAAPGAPAWLCQAVTNKFVLMYGNVLRLVVNHSGYLHQPVEQSPEPRARLLRSNLLVPADELRM